MKSLLLYERPRQCAFQTPRRVSGTEQLDLHSIKIRPHISFAVTNPSIKYKLRTQSRKAHLRPKTSLND